MSAPSLGEILDRMTGILQRIDPATLTAADVVAVRRLAARAEDVFESAVHRESADGHPTAPAEPGATNGRPGDGPVLSPAAPLSASPGA